jgi:xanthine dehydrogenase D subunit/xanthine dehydrogenase C subunit
MVRVVRPRTSEEALSLKGEAGGAALYVAGATALQLDWVKGASQPDVLIDLTHIEALSGIDVEAGAIRIGAATKLGVAERSELLRDKLPLIADAIRVVAAPSVRNLGTVGGNVAGRTGCLLPALLVSDARLRLVGGAGERTLALAEWLAGPVDRSELLVAVSIPIEAFARAIHRKVGLRAAFTPSLIGAAGVLVTDATGAVKTARFAIGGGIVRPQRLPRSEALAVGRPPENIDWRAVHDSLLGEIEAPDDAFRTGAYRRRVAANVIVAGLRGSPSSTAPRRAATPAVRRPPAERTLSHAVAGNEWRVRPDEADKVFGRFPYLTDHRRPEILVARILRAGIPHARILSVDTSAAEALPGVAAVVTAKDVRGLNGYGIVVQDMPALCDDKVRYAGDAVAAVAATDGDIARAALALIKVEYEPLPVVDRMEAALEPGAAAVHAAGNLQRELHFARGDVDAAAGSCAHIVEDTYVTPRQMHTFMETEGGYVVPEADGSLTVCVGAQYGLRDRMQLARILAMPEERIRIISGPTGGAFGGKDELTVQPAMCLLALKSGKPVRLQLDRAESVAAGWKRNPMRIRMRTGCDAEGRLVFQDVDVLSECGAYASLSPGVLETALEHACGPYVIPNIRTHGRLVYTNNGVCSAFRGFGANQMTYAIECQVSRLAEFVGCDPLEMRRINLRAPGTPGPLGQSIGPSERLVEMLEGASASPLWAKPRGPSDGHVATGVGMALNFQGNGLGSVIPDPGGGRLSLGDDGKIEAAFGLNEMGQGILPAIQSCVAAALGCDREDVRPIIDDTGRTPESGSTSAARGIYVVWRSAQLAGADLGAKLRAVAGTILQRAPQDLAIVPGGVGEAGSNSRRPVLSFAELARRAPSGALAADAAFEFPKSDYHKGNARFLFATGAALARVSVDRLTGEVRILELEQHTAAGPVVDVAAYLGQVEGGAVQGLGFTLTEDALMERGAYLTANLDTYMVPSVADAPRSMRVLAVESLDPGDPYGPRGVGEIGIGAVAPAIAAAVADAIGVWPAVTPFRPEELMAESALA